METNYKGNFFGDLDEVNTLKYITGYICIHILTSDRSYKATKKELKKALLYITSHISKLQLLDSDIHFYLSILMDEVIHQYQDMEEYMWCLNLLNLKEMFDKYYADIMTEKA